MSGVRTLNVDRMVRHRLRTSRRTCAECATLDARMSAAKPGTMNAAIIGAERIGHMFQEHWTP